MDDQGVGKPRQQPTGLGLQADVSTLMVEKVVDRPDEPGAAAADTVARRQELARPRDVPKAALDPRNEKKGGASADGRDPAPAPHCLAEMID